MEYKKPTKEFIEKLEATLPGKVKTGEDINPDYQRDEMSLQEYKMPDVVVLPTSTEEVSQICKICYEYDVPFIVRGAGSGLSGGCVPIVDSLIIDMTKMNQIVYWDEADLIVRVQAGILVDTIQKECEARGYMYAPDPGQRLATVAGNVSTNAGGMRAVEYGVTRDSVASMTVVLADGRIMNFGADVNKNCSGYPLMHLMIGSEGTLAIITEVSMRLVPQPKSVISVLVPFKDFATAIENVSRVKGAGLTPQTLEFLTKQSVAEGETLTGPVYPKTLADGTEVNAYLLITFDGRSEDDVYTQIEDCVAVLTENGANEEDIMIADTPAKYNALWDCRRKMAEAVTSPRLYDEGDIVVPISKLADMAEFAIGLSDEFSGYKIIPFGHAGDGNLHIIFIAKDQDMNDDDFKADLEKFLDKCFAKERELKGAMSGEHGIGRKVDYLIQDLGQEQVDLMLATKKAWDPKLLLNPGKVCYKL